MNTPKIKVEMNKGKRGVELEKLAAIAKDTAKFLISLSVDLGEPETEWIADNFKNGSVCFEVESKREIQREPEIWKEALHSVMANDYSNEVLNVRIRPETRTRFFEISKSIPEGDFVSFGICKNGSDESVEWHRLDQSIANKIVEAIEPKTKNHGEIQGIVHAFYKETKPPKLIVRELCTRNLVDCYFEEGLYDVVIAMLKDKDGVIFMEGEISETENGEISEMRVSDFNPAPDFDENLFESQIGKFQFALTGKMDAAAALDEFRS